MIKRKYQDLCLYISPICINYISIKRQKINSHTDSAANYVSIKIINILNNNP